MSPPAKRRRDGDDVADAVSRTDIAFIQAKVYDLPLETLQQLLVSSIPTNPELMAQVSQAHVNVHENKEAVVDFDPYRKTAYDLLNDEDGHKKHEARAGTPWKEVADVLHEINSMFPAIFWETIKEAPYGTRRNAAMAMSDILKEAFFHDTVIAKLVREKLNDAPDADWDYHLVGFLSGAFTEKELEKLALERTRDDSAFLDQITRLAELAESWNKLTGLKTAMWQLVHPWYTEPDKKVKEAQREH